MSKTNWPTSSRHTRGYGSAWDKQRLRILARDHGICQPCLKQGGIHAGTEVDHIVSRAIAHALGWTYGQTESDDNLQAINTVCHRIKTDAEQGRTSKPRSRIGLDGYPVD
mgnify:CR=1 FL=1